MPSRYTRKTMATHYTHIQVIIIIIILRMRSACAEALQTYIYIYTHRESLVRNHEPCAKALGNNATETKEKAHTKLNGIPDPRKSFLRNFRERQSKKIARLENLPLYMVRYDAMISATNRTLLYETHTVVWEILDLEIFSYNNNCSKFKRVKFSHRKFVRSEYLSRVYAVCTYNYVRNTIARVEEEYIIIIIVIHCCHVYSKLFQAQGRSA